MFFVFILIVVFVIPYGVYLNKRYKESSNKNVFLNDHFYKSNLWVILLILVPFVLINLFLASGEVQVTKDKEDPLTSKTIDSLSHLKDENMADVDFHHAYASACFSQLITTNDQRQEGYDYYNELVAQGSDFGYLGKGIYFYNKTQFDSAIHYLKKIGQRNLKYKNFELARSFYQNGDKESAFNFFIDEAANENGYREKAFLAARQVADELGSQGFLLKLVQLPEVENYLGYHLPRKVMFQNSMIGEYYGWIYKYVSHNMNWVGLAAAFLILIVWITYLIKLGFYDSIRWHLLIITLVMGMICCSLVFPLSDSLHFGLNLWQGEDGIWSLLSYSVIGVGAVEELVKILPLLIILLFVRLSSFEYILLASTSALGFAFVENLIYFDGNYGQIIHGRSLTAAVGHMIDSSIFAYGFVLAKFRHKKLKPVAAFFIFWVLASVAHGLYDFWIFAEVYLFFILFFFLLARVWITIINNVINNSPNFTYEKNFDTKSIQFYLAFSLTSILMFEYVVVAFLEGASIANQSLYASSFSGSFMIIFLGSKLSSLNLIKDYWGRINYSINPFSDDIVSQNYVGEKVFLSTYYIDRGLVEYYPQGVYARIVERVVLKNHESTLFFSYDNPNWFMVSLEEAHTDPNFNKEFALIKFREPYSSLNDRKFFEVNFLLIPEEQDNPKMRKNYHSLGWAFLRLPHMVESRDNA